jgi:hypothetical protein
VYSSLIGNYEGCSVTTMGRLTRTSLRCSICRACSTTPTDVCLTIVHTSSSSTAATGPLGSFSLAETSTCSPAFRLLGSHPVYGNNEQFVVQRGTAIVPTVTANDPNFPNIVNSIGSARTPTTMNLDLGLHYPIKFGEKRELRLTGDWFNVFNSQRALTLDQTYQINSGATGVPPVLNPFYGAAVLVQAPSAFRFGAKFTF